MLIFGISWALMTDGRFGPTRSLGPCVSHQIKLSCHFGPASRRPRGVGPLISASLRSTTRSKGRAKIERENRRVSSGRYSVK